MKKAAYFLAGIFLSWAVSRLSASFCAFSGLPHYSAREIGLEERNEEWTTFSRPVAIKADGHHLFVLDSADCEIRVFMKSGAFLYAFGRKGRGPGEFDMPNDMDVQSERIFVADTANRRVQILDRKGQYMGGFGVPFFPQRILALGDEMVIVAHLPSGFGGQEKMLHAYTPRGELLWEALDSFYSEDSVYDAMRNEVFLKKAGRMLYVIPRCLGRLILEMNGEGKVVREIEVGEEYPLRSVAIPAKRGPRELPAFCWSSDCNEGQFYLLIPEYTDKKDLGPGTRMALVEGGGKVRAFVDFPGRISRFAVDGDRIYGVDTDFKLRIFGVEGK